MPEILLQFETPPQRVVSLVPSYTDSLFSLGLGKVVVGVTDYCPTASEEGDLVTRLGGPRSIRIDDVLGLSPDLVLANYEENTRQVVETLESHHIPVWVSFPRTVQDTLDFLWGLVEIFRSQSASVKVRLIEGEVEWVRRGEGDRPKIRYFCPIWQGETSDGEEWWMTFNQETYPHSVLDLMGGENIFAQRFRHYPLAADLGREIAEDAGDRDIRYPCVSKEEVDQANPEIIFLPDEPYAFSDENVRHFLEVFHHTPAVKNGRVYMIDGSLVNWYGTRLANALADLPQYFSIE